MTQFDLELSLGGICFSKEKMSSHSDSDYVNLIRVRAGVASVSHNGMRYIVFNNERPGPIAGPGNILDDWPSLHQAGFGPVDAILPVSDDPPQAYLCRGEAALIKLGSSPGGDLLVESPESTDKCWPTLPWKYSYRADAALRNPDNESEAYSPLGGTRVTGYIAHAWATLRKVGLDSPSEAILPHPGNRGEAYFFVKEHYFVLDIRVVQRKASWWMVLTRSLTNFRHSSMPASTRIEYTTDALLLSPG
ncbi:hypothetical protein EDB19DRAFT_1823486 [Suillus lakei]|nr:hypothetical protein EDB19DRAFT_1823486 [Suillus lakei]